MGRLRPFFPMPNGIRVASFPGDLRLRLDLKESHQRDLFFGLYDYTELALLREALSEGGDFIDVGAHIGFYTVAAALAIPQGRGDVVALEPHPRAREQLLANLQLNEVQANVIPQAAGEASGESLLHVPPSDDPSWSSLLDGKLQHEGQAIGVQVTTVDRVNETLGLHPAVVKIDVEGYELPVLRGARTTLFEHRPLLVCEVSEDTAVDAATLLAEAGYAPYRPVRKKVTPGLGSLAGIFNVVFVPPQRKRLVA
jgi:FkbM family methyltransferase